MSGTSLLTHAVNIKEEILADLFILGRNDLLGWASVNQHHFKVCWQNMIHYAWSLHQNTNGPQIFFHFFFFFSFLFPPLQMTRETIVNIGAVPGIEIHSLPLRCRRMMDVWWMHQRRRTTAVVDQSSQSARRVMRSLMWATAGWKRRVWALQPLRAVLPVSAGSGYCQHEGRLDLLNCLKSLFLTRNLVLPLRALRLSSALITTGGAGWGAVALWTQPPTEGN